MCCFCKNHPFFLLGVVKNAMGTVRSQSAVFQVKSSPRELAGKLKLEFKAAQDQVCRHVYMCAYYSVQCVLCGPPGTSART